LTSGKPIVCQECGYLRYTDNEFCENPLCEDADSDNYSVQAQRFAERIRRTDFAVGDSFWIGGIQVYVTSVGVGSVCLTQWNR